MPHDRRAFTVYNESARCPGAIPADRGRHDERYRVTLDIAKELRAGPSNFSDIHL